MWVSGHSNILWNGLADNLSKDATKHTPAIKWLVPEDIFFQTSEKNLHKLI